MAVMNNAIINLFLLDGSYNSRSQFSDFFKKVDWLYEQAKAG